MHISINNFIFKHLSAKTCYIDFRGKLHSIKSEIWGCILEVLMKNLHLFIPQFFGFDETLKCIILFMITDICHLSWNLFIRPIESLEKKSSTRFVVCSLSFKENNEKRLGILLEDDIGDCTRINANRKENKF